MHPSGDDAKTGGRIGLLRSLGAMFYYALLLFSVWYVVAALVLWTRGGELPAAGDPGLTALLIACAYLYFAAQWARGGQTLGMKTWRIRLTGRDGATPPGWPRASLRFVVAVGGAMALGIGYLWALWDADGLTLPDRLSGTRRRLVNGPP